MVKTFEDILFPVMLFFILILLIAFSVKTVTDVQVGMAVGSVEMNETNFFLTTSNVVFAVFFNPVGVLVGIMMLIGVLIIGASMVTGLRSNR